MVMWPPPHVCKYAPNIDPTSSVAHPVDIVRIFRMAEEPAPALVATPDEAQKTVLDQMLRSKRQRVNIARDFAAVSAWYRRNRHLPMRYQHAHLSRMMRGLLRHIWQLSTHTLVRVASRAGVK